MVSPKEGPAITGPKLKGKKPKSKERPGKWNSPGYLGKTLNARRAGNPLFMQQTELSVIFLFGIAAFHFLLGTEK